MKYGCIRNPRNRTILGENSRKVTLDGTILTSNSLSLSMVAYLHKNRDNSGFLGKPGFSLKLGFSQEHLGFLRRKPGVSQMTRVFVLENPGFFERNPRFSLILELIRIFSRKPAIYMALNMMIYYRKLGICTKTSVLS